MFRNRKEWKRQLNASGTGLLWHRARDHADDDDSSSEVAPIDLFDSGCVVNFVRDDQVALMEDWSEASVAMVDLSDDGQEAFPLEEVVVVGGDDSKGQCLSGLQLDARKAEKDGIASSVVMELAEVKDGEPVLFDASEADAGIETVEAFCNLAAQDFPTKYAHFATAIAALRGDAAERSTAPIQLDITRGEAYDNSMALLSQVAGAQMRAVMRVRFDGESGVDAGGLLRDWFCVMSDGLVGESTTRVFVTASDPDRSFYLDGGVDEQLSLAAGRFIGRALLEGYPLGFHLSLPLLKMIVGVPVTFDDLEHFDPECFQSLKWLLENNEVDALALTFSVGEMNGSAVTEHELVPGGASVDVTDANKVEFVALKFRHLVFGRVEAVLQPFLTGIFEVIPRSLLMLFDPEELDYLLSGSDEIDIEDWRRNTKYSEELHDHPAMRWFWELVEEMPLEHRRRLLRFATGSARVPIGGFGALTSYDGRLCPFTLKGVSWIASGGYIRSHACFNRLDLPLYVDRDDLKQVLFALLDSEAEGFTTA